MLHSQGIKRAILYACCLASLAAALLFFVSPAAAYDDQELAFLSLINGYRQQNGLLPLTLSASLSSAALGHSEDMAVHNFFSHTSSDGSTPWDRIRAAGYTYSTWLGENIAAGYNDAQSVFNAWRASPDHNANMLDPNYRAIGISRYYGASSSYGWYWTTDFGGVAEAPYVTIPAPTGAAMVSGLVIFQANAFDYAGIARVNLFIDGQPVASRTVPPFSYYWNTTAFANGNHTLFATANGGNAAANVAVYINGALKRQVSIPAGGNLPLSYPETMGGPVRVISVNSRPLYVTQRVIYKNSFNEIAGQNLTS